MLQTGIIQPNHIPFSSPISLVKKKDNACVDYRRLNHIIIKDKFPIQIIDELPIHGVSILSKIHLRLFYH